MRGASASPDRQVASVPDLAAARRSAGLTTKELARRVGISLWEMDRIERDPSEIDPEVRDAIQEHLPWSPPDPAEPVVEHPGRDSEDREDLDRRSEELARRAAELDAERERTAAGTEELETERQATIAEAERVRRDLEESRAALREHERDLLRRENELELERKRTQAATDRAAETLAEARAQVDARDQELARRSQEIEQRRRRKNLETKRLLARSRRELDEAWARATVAERRVAELEAAGAKPELAAGPVARAESGTKPADGAADGVGEAAGIAEISFADLRRVGLSITQAKRVLRYRDERGELRSADDLERVPGLTDALRERIKHELTY